MMTRDDKTQQLKHNIAIKLEGVIDRNYALLGIPYYMNIGDILIWEGEREYLNTQPFKCVNIGYRYDDLWRIKDDTLIVLQGGGNFGDLWRFIQEERLMIIKRYAVNPIVIFPITCWYEDESVMRHDAEIMSKHPNLTICARDLTSYEMLIKNFSNRILLVPDMAFFIRTESLRKYIKRKGTGILYFKRTDKELSSDDMVMHALTTDRMTVADWPSMEKMPTHWLIYKKLCRWSRKAQSIRVTRIIAGAIIKMSNLFYHQISRRLLIKQGVLFIGRHRCIYTTRLHGAILAILLNKDVKIIDNSYGKNSSYYKTWLSDVEGVDLLN